MAYLSLLDWSRRVGPDGSIDDIAELLSQCNEVFKDMLWRESNLPTGHKCTVRTGLPSGTWRSLYGGIAPTKSTTAQITDGVGSLEGLSQIDVDLAQLDGDVGGTRMSEDNAFLEGMSQQMATTIFYGNSSTSPTQFTGFAPRFNTVTTSTAANARNVLNAGGTASANASIWLIGWGDETCFGIFPKGSKAGLVFEDRGDINFAYDANNNPFRVYTSWFQWKAGLVVKDWRYVTRIANIDTTTVGLQGITPPDLFALMSKSVVRLPTMSKRVSGITETDAPDEPAPGIAPAFYCNRSVREYLDIQAIRDKNVLLTPKEYAGEPVVEFRGVPIRVVDALTNTEATLT
jgi:hypothetical protein